MFLITLLVLGLISIIGYILFVKVRNNTPRFSKSVLVQPKQDRIATQLIEVAHSTSLLSENNDPNRNLRSASSASATPYKKIKTISSAAAASTHTPNEANYLEVGGLRKRLSRCSGLSPQTPVSPTVASASVSTSTTSNKSKQNSSDGDDEADDSDFDENEKASLSRTLKLDDDVDDNSNDETTIDYSHRALMMLPMEFQKMLSAANNSNKSDTKSTKTLSPKVKQLDLSANQLSVLPAWFFQNTQFNQQLTRLDLSQNKFFEIQSGLSKMTHLKYLNLSHNRLEQFPMAIIQCTELISLDLSENSIAYLPHDISRLQNLKELDISDNLLLSLPESMVQMKSLNQFFLQNNRFIDSIHHILSEMQKNNASLQILQMDTEKEKRKSGSVRKTISDRVKSKQDRLHALRELLKSETQYCNFLQLMFNEFYKPLCQKNMSQCTLDYSSIVDLSDEVKVAMFPKGLSGIVNFNMQLLDELKKHINTESDETLEQSRVASIFIDRAPFFKVYSNYIAGYHSAHRLLMDTINKNEEFAKLIQKGRSLPGCNGVDLPSLLIMPIQRIPRYVLLLKAIVDNTDSLHPDFKPLNTAVQLMSDNAAYVNTKILEAANLRKVMDIQQELNFQDLVAPHRTFVKEGNLFLRKPTQDKTEEGPVKVFLFNDMLIITEYKILYALFGGFIRRFPLEQVQVKDCADPEDTEFDIVIPSYDKSYRMRTNSVTEKKSWVDVIQKYIKESTVE